MEVRLVWFEWRLAVCDMNWMFGLGGFFEFKTNFGHDCSTVRGSDQRRLLRDTINSLTVVPCGPRCYLSRWRKNLSLHIWQESICLNCIGRYWQHFCRHNRSLASVWLDLLRSGSNELNDEQCKQLKQGLRQYTRFDFTDNGSENSLLHWTCYLPNISLDLVRLLLEVKANHNALDRYGRTPLHIVAVNWDSRANVVEVANLLMDAGCHLNQKDKNGKTALQLFQEMHCRVSAEGLLDTAPNLEDLIHPVVLPLTCYCAQSIRKHKIPFKTLIPTVVESFVEKHGQSPWTRFPFSKHHFTNCLITLFFWRNFIRFFRASPARWNHSLK